MNLADIENEFDVFFESQTDSRLTVTSASARLFAEHIMKIERLECANLCKKLAHEYKNMGPLPLNQYNQTFNEGRAEGADVCADAINDRWKI